MRLFLFSLLLSLHCVVFAQQKESVHWVSLEDALQQAKEQPKAIFIDVYTEWCGWCKRLDATTYQDSSFVQYINTNYYCVKLDAEQKKDIIFNGHTYKFIQNGKSGYHEFAALLLNGQMSYPTMVVLSPSYQRTHVIIGYQSATQLLQRLAEK